MTMMRIVVASKNYHKVKEIKDIVLKNLYPIEVLSLLDLIDIPQLTEPGYTFRENAFEKAHQVAIWLRRNKIFEFEDDNLWIMADDSGLEVDVLNGAPGVMSARFANQYSQVNLPDDANLQKLLTVLEGVPLEKRKARFKCVIALINSPITEVWFFEGICEGIIVDTPKGNGGFGYDPIFQPLGYDKTFGELSADIKNSISHRAHAIKKFIKWLDNKKVESTST